MGSGSESFPELKRERSNETTPNPNEAVKTHGDYACASCWGGGCSAPQHLDALQMGHPDLF